MKNNYYLFFLFFIIVLGSFLRIYRLSIIPSGFFADEASIGYNAYTILTKGTDEYRTPFPLFFRAFGEYKSPMQIYATVPFVFLFGLNEFSTRLPSAIFGTISILAIYLLTKQLFIHHKNSVVIALFSAFFLAISPWHIHFSHIAFELMPFTFFTTLSLYFFLKAQKIQKSFIVALLLLPLLSIVIFPHVSLFLFLD